MLAFPKFRNGKTLQEERAEKRTQRTSREQSRKSQVRRRDKKCRWRELGHCCWQEGIRAEVAHTKAKGMGGDRRLDRSTPELMILLCHPIHQGPDSLHSGDRRIVPLTPKGTAGPVACQVLRGGRWLTVGVSEP